MQELGLNQQVSDGHILKFSSSHGSKWKLMPAPLDLKNIVAEDIDRAPKSEEEKRHTFFTTWKQVKGSFATYKALIIALLEVDCQEDAESLCRLVPQDPQNAKTDAEPANPFQPGSMNQPTSLDFAVQSAPLNQIPIPSPADQQAPLNHLPALDSEQTGASALQNIPTESTTKLDPIVEKDLKHILRRYRKKI